MPAFTSKRLLRSPLVTVRRGRATAITFNTALSVELGIPRFRYAAIRHDPVTRAVQFTLSNDELAHGGSYKLGFNGGGCKKRGSPSRCLQVPNDRVPFLATGTYRAEAREIASTLVVTIRLDQPVA